MVDMRQISVRIYRGKGERAIYLYGEIRDFTTDELLVSASAKYCSDVIKERDYHIMALNVEE